MSFVAAILAIVAFAIAAILGWDAGLTLGVLRAVLIGLIALSVALVLPAETSWPWRRP